MAPRLGAPHKPKRGQVKNTQIESEIEKKKRWDSERDGESRQHREAGEDVTKAKDQKWGNINGGVTTEQKTDEHRLNETHSEQSTSNTANLFSKTDTNENLCNKNTPSPPAMIWKQILHYSAAVPRKPSITREGKSADHSVPDTLWHNPCTGLWGDPLSVIVNASSCTEPRSSNG